MKIIQEEGARPIKLWTDDIEDSALQQVKNIAKLPIVEEVAVMPDVHYGIGATVGSVIPTISAVIPAAVGVDIGCGMMAVRLAGARAKDLPDSLKQIRSEIEHTIPTGFGRHDVGKRNEAAALTLFENFAWMQVKHAKAFERRKQTPWEMISSQFGSLGGGNHFIELCVDENQELWAMLHSGSRGIGNAIGQYFIELAKDDMRAHHDYNLPDKDLAYLREGTEHFTDYWQAVSWAQDFARANRDEMMRRLLIVLHRHLPPFREREEAVNCHHNYVSREYHRGKELLVTRKGAISAREGEMGIIPGSMGAKSYIVRGRGNPESFHSCSHGAGRRMGRKQAMRTYTLDDLKAQTAGIECTLEASVVDEIPAAYKDIDVVMENQRDLVEVVHTLKQVLCVKGA